MASRDNQTSEDRKGERPLFKYSPRPEIVSAFSAFVFVLIATAYALFSGGIAFDFLNLAWITFIELFLLYLIMTRWRLRLDSIQFFEDCAIVKRHAKLDEMWYHEVLNVSLSKSIWSGSKVRIEATSGANSFTLPKNPTNRTLGLDLYSWLQGKTAKS
jgi:Zn-dependent protease with chaperone function